ncbi:MAG: oxygen-independent coproporphyrinogen III oxidase [Bradymonadia bacterium]
MNHRLAPPEALPRLEADLIQKMNVRGPRYTSYPPVPLWTSDFGAPDLEAALSTAAQAGAKAPLSLYIHVPFCKSLCTYCGCNVVVSRDRARMDAYVDRVLVELDLLAERLGDRNTLSRIHWGGGTPTWLDDDQLKRLWYGIQSSFTLQKGAEIAVELHPGITDIERLQRLRGLGFNRLSMGVQDFDPAVQQAIGRVQSISHTACLVSAARALGFESINFDLVYGLPAQTLKTWQHTLDVVADMAPDRLAIYGFAYLPEQRANQRKIDASQLPTPATRVELFTAAYGHFVEHGMVPIGMDHFARPDDELAVAQRARRLWRDFQGYTVKRAHDTIAVGATAISDVGGAYAQNVSRLGVYGEHVDRGELPVARGIKLTAEDQLRRQLITQIMCNFWVDLADFSPEGRDVATVHARYAHELEALEPLVADDLVDCEGTELSLTPRGRLFVRNLAMIFDPHLQTGRPQARYSRTI